jgi:hypothetical protein
MMDGLLKFTMVAALLSSSVLCGADPAFSWGITQASVDFAGFAWYLKDAPTTLLQPGPCYFLKDLVRSDVNGLHVSVAQHDGAWLSSEVMIGTSFGYGTYRVEVLDSLADHNEEVVLGVFLWDDTTPENYNGEIDLLEASRFGDPFNPFNAQQVLAPWNLPDRINRFAIPANLGPATVVVEWSPASLVYTIECPLLNYKTTWSPDPSMVPSPTGFERLHINAWLNFGYPPSDGQGKEFTAFAFTPSGATQSLPTAKPPQSLLLIAPAPSPLEDPMMPTAPPDQTAYPNLTEIPAILDTPNPTAILAPAPNPTAILAPAPNPTAILAPSRPEMPTSSSPVGQPRRPGPAPLPVRLPPPLQVVVDSPYSGGTIWSLDMALVVVGVIFGALSSL